jgi:quinolinate synthase
MTQATYEYSRQDAAGATCTANAWAKVTPVPGPAERVRLKARATELLAQHDATLVAHYYVDGDLQDLALETGGLRRRFARDGPLRRAQPTRRSSSPACASWARPRRSCRPTSAILMPDLDATCSLDLGCPPTSSPPSATPIPTATVVVYANTSAP